MADRKVTDNVSRFNAQRTPEERQELARQAGLASGEARRKRKRLRETLSDVLSAHVTAEDVLAALEGSGFEKPTHQEALIYAAVARAERGDIEAARFVRDTVGERPSEALQVAFADAPVRAWDLSQMSDDDLQAAADRMDG